ncbi:hypothetical protein DPMN_044845 [Dreissena polymorpha]|uniref:Uncharacterized protein n=1 Tax=Dreissena polymorpha TaxID=45954 RepID=A0A9D4HZB4_DREPO|nr:hypothetical protein DPMN_044845 [Dreissena polymorpha]
MAFVGKLLGIILPDVLTTIPIMIELYMKPIVSELKTVIDCLSSGKASEKDGIPPEVIKC